MAIFNARAVRRNSALDSLSLPFCQPSAAARPKAYRKLLTFGRNLLICSFKISFFNNSYFGYRQN